MTAPAPSVCPTCEGFGLVFRPLNSEVSTVEPCTSCRCVCGGPLGHRCELLDDIDDDYQHKVTDGSR